MGGVKALGARMAGRRWLRSDIRRHAVFGFQLHRSVAYGYSWRDRFSRRDGRPAEVLEAGESRRGHPHRHTHGNVLMAWPPYLMLVVFVLLWGSTDVKALLDKATVVFDWPGLHNLVQRIPPVVAKPTPYAALYTFTWLSASGTACLLSAILSAMVAGVSLSVRMSAAAHSKTTGASELTLASVLALAYLMNYSGATATLGLAFAATGVMFPFFSALLGWLGVFLTGSDTSANALFGTLQVVTAEKRRDRIRY